MGWYRRGEKRYYFRSVRTGKSTRKVYVGAGRAGEFSFRIDRLQRYERTVQQEHWRSQQTQVEAALAAFEAQVALGDLLRDSVLFAAGFHRPDRHPWRRRRNVL